MRIQLLAAFDITKEAWKQTRRLAELKKAVQGLNIKGEPICEASSLYIDGQPNIPASLEYLKARTVKLCNILDGVSAAINTIFNKASHFFLDEGFNASGLSKSNVEFDIADYLNMIPAEKTKISKAETMKELDNVKNMVIHPRIVSSPPASIIETYRALNIAHDLADAISYNLHGRNSDTGEYGLSNDQISHIVRSRLNVASYYRYKGEGEDSALIYAVLDYIERNLGKEQNSVLAEYIDNNLPKLVLVRRWWALNG